MNDEPKDSNCNEAWTPETICFTCNKDFIPPEAPFSIAKLMEIFDNNTEFAKQFKKTLFEANRIRHDSPGADPDDDEGSQSQASAIKCIQRWYCPHPDELAGAGVPRAQHNAKRKCTDSALLLAIKLKDTQI